MASDMIAEWELGGYARVPCPGCGSGHDLQRRDGQVCYKCRADLKTAKEFKVAYDAACAGLEHYAISLQSSWHCGWNIKPSHLDEAETVPLRHLLADLVRRAGLPAQGKPEAMYDRDHVIPYPVYSRAHADSVFRMAAPGLGQLVQELLVEFNRLTDKSYATGVDRGRDLLGQLAKGEVSIGDFDANRGDPK